MTISMMNDQTLSVKHARNLLEKNLRYARLSDSVRLKREWNRLNLRDLAPDTILEGTRLVSVKKLLERSEKAQERSLEPFAEKLHITYPENLPIAARAGEIEELIRNNQVLIVAGATGSGKTTQLPKMALAAGCGRLGRIGCTQPRRLAASSLAHRAAEEMQAEFGCEVGYKVRFDDHTSENTVVKFMTDGILLAETRDDPDLLQYDCIMLDEVHERSLNIDFLLGYLKRLLQKRRNLKLIISSATLESQSFAEFFNDAPFVEIEGRTYPIEDYYMEPYKDEELSEHIARAVEFITELDPRGDILVFLPGEREIRDANELLTGRQLARTELVPLFGRLSSAEQNRIFSPSRQRRIVLATNVAETSLTIPGIRYVIDSGLVRLSRYNPRTRIQELQVEFIAQSSIRQRRGRCGRLEDGICVHLYSEDDAKNAQPYTDPEIKRSSLAGVILQMASLKLGKIESFPLVDPPAPGLIRDGYRTLSDLGAIDEHGSLTPCGWDLSSMPLDPQLGKMLERAFKRKVLKQMLVIAAYLSIPDPRERPFEKTSAADTAHKQWASEKSDFAAAVNLYDALEHIYNERSSYTALRKYCQQNFLNYRRVREWRNLVEDLSVIVRERSWESAIGSSPLNEFDYDALHMALLSGLPRQLGCFDREQKNYFDMSGKRFKIFPGSGLSKRKTMPQWLLSFALVETSQVFARTCAEVKPEWLMSAAPALCTAVYDQAHYSPQSGFVSARERITCGRLLIHPGRQRHYGPVNPVEARKIFIKDALIANQIGEHQIRHIKWLEQYVQSARKVRKFELKMRRPELLFNEEGLTEFFEKNLPARFYSIQEIKEHWKRFHKNFFVPEELLFSPEELSGDPETDYPDELTFCNVKFPLEYTFAPGEERDGMTLIADQESVKLLPVYALDALVPGFLGEKLEFYLKSLPRSDRQKIAPLHGFIQEFCRNWKSGRIFNDQPLADALADELSKHAVVVNSNAFDDVPLPEYLKMKLLILNEEGEEAEYLYEVPAPERSTSKLSAVLPGAKDFYAEAGKGFPMVPALPEFANVGSKSNEKAYPALFADDEGNVGCACYLKAAEAYFRHDQGLCALMRQQLPGLFTAIRRDFKLANELEKRYFKVSSEHMQFNWKDDLLNSAILKALGSEDRRWQLRSKAACDSAREAARGRFAATGEELFATLKDNFESAGKVRSLLKKLPSNSLTASDIECELDFYFRPGFLRYSFWHERYKRYLRGLELRLQRAIANPKQDENKFAPLEDYVERMDLALNNIPELALAPMLCEFVLFMQELRLSIFAPEVRPLEKVSLEKLKQKWNDLRV